MSRALVALLCLGCASASPAPRRPILARHSPPALFGVYTDGTRDSLDDAATDLQRRSWLWLRADGTYLLAAPGWTIERGRWDADHDTLRLEPTEVAHGVGGGQQNGRAIPASCHRTRVARPILRRLGREPIGGGDVPGEHLRAAHQHFVRWHGDELHGVKDTWPRCTS